MNRPTQKESAKWLVEFLRQYRKGEKEIDLNSLTPGQLVGLMNGTKIDKKDETE